MSTIFCDNDGCMFSDGCGFCDCDKLSIVGGVCEGSMHGGRNASDGDIDERLKTENDKLRELVRDMLEEIEVYGLDPMYEEEPSWRIGIRELGIEVD